MIILRQKRQLLVLKTRIKFLEENLKEKAKKAEFATPYVPVVNPMLSKSQMKKLGGKKRVTGRPRILSMP